nr:MAG TPA: hypothetical protein [Bacteriophage sp.]
MIAYLLIGSANVSAICAFNPRFIPLKKAFIF